jgi:hypothetical protein
MRGGGGGVLRRTHTHARTRRGRVARRRPRNGRARVRRRAPAVRDGAFAARGRDAACARARPAPPTLARIARLVIGVADSVAPPGGARDAHHIGAGVLAAPARCVCVCVCVLVCVLCVVCVCVCLRVYVCVRAGVGVGLSASERTLASRCCVGHVSQDAHARALPPPAPAGDPRRSPVHRASPAAAAASPPHSGLHVGDIILAVNNVSVVGHELKEVRACVPTNKAAAACVLYVCVCVCVCVGWGGQCLCAISVHDHHHLSINQCIRGHAPCSRATRAGALLRSCPTG